LSDTKQESSSEDSSSEEEPKRIPTPTPTQPKKRKSSPFRRVKAENVEITNKGLADNSFSAKKGFDQYGKKADQTLSAVKGKNFRKDKTKKKKGSYGGGPISTGVNSIKF